MMKKPKILVVEDERIVAEDIRYRLSLLDYNVLGTVSSGKEALESARQEKPDLVLMDIYLKGKMTGIETADLLWKQDSIPVVFLSAYADKQTIDKVKKTEPFGYILKPFEDKELQSVIEVALYKYQIQLQLKERETWFSSTLKSIGDGVITMDQKGKVNFINPVAEMITGWTLDEIRDKPFQTLLNFVDEQTNKPVKIPISKILETGKDWHFPDSVCLTNRHGRHIPVSDCTTPIRDEKGGVFGLVLVFRDISAQRENEASIQYRIQFENLIISISTDLINLDYTHIDEAIHRALRRIGEFTEVDRSYVFLFDKNQNNIRCAHEWYSETLYPIGPSCRNLHALDFSWSIDQIKSGDVVYVQDLKSLPGDAVQERAVWGKRGVRSLIHVPLRMENRSIGFLGFESSQKNRIWPEDIISLLRIVSEILVNTLERQRTEEALEHTEREMALILSSLSAIVMHLDKEDIILWANPATSEALGKPLESIVGQKYADVWPDTATDMNESPVRHVFETGNPVSCEIETSDFHVWIIRGYPAQIEGQGIAGVVMVANDITAQKRMEAEKESIQAQLFQVQKMDAVGTLTGGVAHDFNNLLTAIQGCADMALMKVENKDTIYHDLREIQKAASRAADLTRQLLLFSRKHPAKFVPVDINKIINDLLKMLHRLIGEDVGISTALQSNLWTVKADPGTLEQVMMNLSVNARDAMPKGGKLSIRTANVTLDESQSAGMPESRSGEFVKLTFRDTGVGMTDDVKVHIFEPFFSTKGPGRGTGLGLSVVYGIIKQHAGWIDVISVPGTGSSFEIYLPATGEKAPEKTEEMVSIDGLKGNGERILLVEDAEGVREFALMALGENGYQVHSVSNVADALARIGSESEPFDLLFSDVVLPDQSGIELTERVKIVDPKIKILLTSGYTDQKSQWKAIQEEGYPFLQKPYTLISLLKAVHQVMNPGK